MNTGGRATHIPPAVALKCLRIATGVLVHHGSFVHSDIADFKGFRGKKSLTRMF